MLGLPGAPSVYLARLPPKRVLTVNLEVPEAWLVQATKAVYDLDNLRLVRGGETQAQTACDGAAAAPARGLRASCSRPQPPAC